MKKSNYKKISIILAMMITFTIICMPSIQVMAATTGTTENGLNYTIENGNVNITGYTGVPTVLVIPSEIDGFPVTSIGYQAFRECNSLTNVKIPDSVTFIDGEAFNRCVNLNSVKIPDSVTNISWGAFWGCSNLTNIKIPEGVTSIGNGAFGSSGLTNVTLAANLTSTGIGVFNNCNSLTNVTITDEVTSVGQALFSGCNSLTSLTIKNSLTSISSDVFNNCISLNNIIVYKNPDDNSTTKTIYVNGVSVTVTFYQAVKVKIKGTERVGETLSARLQEDGIEVNTGAGATYEWYRLSSKDSNNGDCIGYDDTYKLVETDQGKYIKVIAKYNGKTIEDITGNIVKVAK